MFLRSVIACVAVLVLILAQGCGSQPSVRILSVKSSPLMAQGMGRISAASTSSWAARAAPAPLLSSRFCVNSKVPISTSLGSDYLSTFDLPNRRLNFKQAHRMEMPCSVFVLSPAGLNQYVPKGAVVIQAGDPVPEDAVIVRSGGKSGRKTCPMNTWLQPISGYCVDESAQAISIPTFIPDILGWYVPYRNRCESNVMPYLNNTIINGVLTFMDARGELLPKCI
jgi:hypothetical protein